MGKPKIPKREQLNHLREMVTAVADKFKAGDPDHRTAAVLGMFTGELNNGNTSAEMIHEAWEELADIGKVIRDEFCLRPIGNTWEVIPMIGIDGLNEDEVN